MSGDDVEPLLVLWDIDQTLVEVGPATREAYAAAFSKLVGRPLEQPWQFNGRTELAAVAEILRVHGVRAAPDLIDSFMVLIVDELHARADQMRHDGQVLPGAEAALRACRAVAGLHQSVLTGNLHPLAILKMSVFGLAAHVDLRIGAFGGDAVDRTELPPHAWRRAERHLGHAFTGANTVIVGDTLLDVATGRAAGARVIGVATGPAGAAELRAAGADVVLTDLTDTDAVVDAIVGPQPIRGGRPIPEPAPMPWPEVDPHHDLPDCRRADLGEAGGGKGDPGAERPRTSRRPSNLAQHSPTDQRH